jgi:hypothetical protein
MTYSERWRDKYRNIVYEVFKYPHENHDVPGWYSFIYIVIDYIPEECDREEYWKTPNKEYFHLFDNKVFNALPFHGGISYYKKMIEIDRNDKEFRVIKIGCDYTHDCDCDIEYNEIEVIQNIKHVIDDFIDTFCPKYKIEI